VGSISRNAPCPCGSGRKVKRCSGDVTPVAVARTHDAVGGRLQTAQRYARREDIDPHERDVARRIAAACSDFCASSASWSAVGSTSPISPAPVKIPCVLSHGVSRFVQPGELLVGRLMDGPPAKSLWGPLGVLTQETASQLIDLLERTVTALGISGDADRIARAMRAASREITVLVSARDPSVAPHAGRTPGSLRASMPTVLRFSWPDRRLRLPWPDRPFAGATVGRP
jgi:hypothetical protein